jgi:hypothetical protein
MLTFAAGVLTGIALVAVVWVVVALVVFGWQEGDLVGFNHKRR